MDIPSFDEIFSQIKTNFWLSGIPFGSSKITIRFYFLLFSISTTIACEIAFLVSKTSAENLIVLTQLAPCTCIGILAILKIIIISTKRFKIYQLITCLRQLYNDITKDYMKRKLVKQEFIFLKHLIKYFYLLNAVLILVYNFSTLIIIFYRYMTTHKINFILPYAVLVPFNTDTWASWSVVYLHSMINGFICVLYFTTVDSLYFVMTTHIASHFALLSNEIANIKGDRGGLLNEIVKQHQHILRLSKDLEDIFTAPNLLNVLVGSLEICALGFTLTMGGWADVPGVILFLFSVVLQIFMMSFFGEKIITESGNIREAAYSCGWYLRTMDRRSKKIILMLMQRDVVSAPAADKNVYSNVAVSSTPQRLTAYKFSVISYESFIKIISTSWTYFTILRTVYKTPNLQSVEAS